MKLRLGLCALLLVFMPFQGMGAFGYSMDYNRRDDAAGFGVLGGCLAVGAFFYMCTRGGLKEDLDNWYNSYAGTFKSVTTKDVVEGKVTLDQLKYEHEREAFKKRQAIFSSARWSEWAIKLCAGSAVVAFLAAGGIWGAEQWNAYQRYNTVHPSLRLFQHAPLATVEYTNPQQLGMTECASRAYRPAELGHIEAIVEATKRISRLPDASTAHLLAPLEYARFKKQYQAQLTRVESYPQWLEQIATLMQLHPRDATEAQEEQARRIKTTIDGIVRSIRDEEYGDVFGTRLRVPRNLAAEWSRLAIEKRFTLKAAAEAVSQVRATNPSLFCNPYAAGLLRTIIERCSSKHAAHPLTITNPAAMTEAVRLEYIREQAPIVEDLQHLNTIVVAGGSEIAQAVSSASRLKHDLERKYARIDRLLGPGPAATASAAAPLPGASSAAAGAPRTDVRSSAVATRNASDDDAATGDAPSGKPAVSVAAPTATGLVATAAGTTPAPTAPPVIAHDDEGNPSSAPDAH